MTHDSHGQDHSSHDAPPDQGAQGDVSTTGHSAHDAHGAGAAHDAHGGHGGHGHADDSSDVSTLVPTTWKQLVLPALILVLVAILVSGPVFSAFATRPATPAHTEERTHGGEGGESGESGGGEHTTPAEGTTTPGHTETEGEGGGGEEQHATATIASSPAVASPTSAPHTSPTTVSSPISEETIATRTAVAIEGTKGEVARMPVELEFGKNIYVVKAGSNLLPDWKPSEDLGIATWIEGTYTNHILYLPYSAEHEALFKAAKSGEIMKVTMNTGQVFVFSVTRSERAINGPPTTEGQFTVTTAMRQDHAGVTLFLVGDPSDDRAVVQADFTGTIQ